MGLDGFAAGMTGIPAKMLNDVARAAQRTEEVEGPVGAPISPRPHPEVQILPCYVIARSVNEPTALESHAYTIGFADGEDEIGWSQLIVDTPLSRINPASGQTPVRFVPAAVVGDDEHAINPWRAKGLLFRSPDMVTGEPTAMVLLFGLSMNLGC